MRNWIRRLLFGKWDYYLNAERESLVAEINHGEDKIRSLNGTIDELNGTIDELNGTIDEHNGTIDEHNGTIDELDSSRRDYAIEFGYLTKVLENAKRQIGSQITQYVDLKESHKKRGEKIGELHARALGFVRERDRLECTIRDLEAAVANLQDEIHGMRRDVRAAEDAYDGLFKILNNPNWAIMASINAFDQITKGATYGTAINVTESSLKRHYSVEVTRLRPGQQSAAQRIEYRNQLISDLLNMLGRYCTELDDSSATFNVLFSVSERITIKRSKEILEEQKRCAKATTGSGSTGSPAAANLASAS